jgi:hypothetical protein
MSLVGFEPTITVFKRAKTVHDLDRAVIDRQKRENYWTEFYTGSVIPG